MGKSASDEWNTFCLYFFVNARLIYMVEKTSSYQRLSVNLLFYYLSCVYPVWIYLVDGKGYSSIPLLTICILLQLPFIRGVKLVFLLKFLKSSQSTILLLFLCFYCFVVIFINSNFGMFFQRDEVITSFNYKSVLSWLVYSLSGAILYIHYYKISKVYWFLFLGICSAIFIIISADPGFYTLQYDYTGELKLSHLAISEKYILISAFAIIPFFYEAKLKPSFLIHFSLFAAALFVIGSRTMLYAYFLSGYGLYIYLCYENKKYKAIVFYTLMSIFFLGYISIFSQQFVDYEGLGRMLVVFSDVGEDNSVVGRMYQYSVGISNISENPFFGFYAGDVEHFGGGGNYIHGVLSYWRQFGVLPFIIIVFLSIFSLKVFITSGNLNERSGFFLFLSVIFVLTTFASRAYTYPAIYLSIGAAIVESYKQALFRIANK